MESDEIREALREADRAEAAPWIDYPATPRWWPVLFGAWACVFALNVGYVDGLPQALGSIVLAALMGVAAGWATRRRGTYPRGRAPRELRASFGVLFGGALVIAALGWLIASLITPWPAALVAGVAAYVLVLWYERAYTRAADRVRARLR